MSKPTPGPWEITERSEHRICIQRKHRTRPVTMPLADVHPASLNAEANARLIAASPDLLEALQEIMVDLCAGYEGPTVDKAYAAIAKALGDV